MTLKGLIVFAALILAIAEAGGQVAPTQTGRALDANYQIGSGGYNAIRRGLGGINSQLYVTGQVSGLRSFRGSVGYFAANELRLDLPSAGLDDFRRQSASVRQALAGGTYLPAAYFRRTQTSFGLRGIAAGLTIPGSDVPIRSTVSASQVRSLYAGATARYESLVELPAARGALAVPLAQPAQGKIRLIERPSAKSIVLAPSRGASFFSVLRDEDRQTLARELYEMTQDASQETDVADEQPEVVAALRGEYESWWASVSTRFGESTRTIIGSDYENPVLLTSHDWHTEAAQSAWDQSQIRGGPATRGFWEVTIDRPGRYQFTLRRWPKEAEETSLNTRRIKPKMAFIEIGDKRDSQEVSGDQSEVTFELDLEAGPQRITTTLTEGADSESEKSMGAYFLYAERL